MHLVLARQYRPTVFSEVIGQDVFITLLKNALAQGRMGHAFLLTGIRGVGKTTIARLIAKAVTCTKRTADQEPCNVCTSCTAVLQDKHMDIIEMDAASHTGVDDVRQILEGSQYKPIISTHKIYIIDEVHMLSKSAFNALLKLLEEPPAHVKFILATTEQSKIPATVISRCQQIHLRRLAPQALRSLLYNVCEKEGFQSDDSALDALCQYSEGSARDALSLLEKTLVFLGKKRTITRNDIDTTLGLIPKHEIETFMDIIESHKIDDILEMARRFYGQGIEPTSILRQILSIIYQRTVNAKSSPHRLGALDRLWQITQKGLEEIGTSSFPFLSLEMVLMRLAYVGNFPTPGELLDMIENTSDTTQDAQMNCLSQPSSTSQTNPCLKKEKPHPGLKSASPVQDNTHNTSIDAASPVFTNIDPDSPHGHFFNRFQKYLEQAREALLLAHIQKSVSFVAWDHHTASLSLHWIEKTPPNPSMTEDIAKALSQWQKTPCHIHWQDKGKYKPHAEQSADQKKHTMEQVVQHPNIIDLKTIFPDLSVQSVTTENE